MPESRQVERGQRTARARPQPGDTGPAAEETQPQREEPERTRSGGRRLSDGSERAAKQQVLRAGLERAAGLGEDGQAPYHAPSLREAERLPEPSVRGRLPGLCLLTEGTPASQVIGTKAGNKRVHSARHLPNCTRLGSRAVRISKSSIKDKKKLFESHKLLFPKQQALSRLPLPGWGSLLLM